MDQFLSTFTNKIDAKGRISVPADFRAVLTKRGSGGLVLGPSERCAALEGGGEDYLKDIQKQIDSLPPFSPERQFLIDAKMPALRHLTPDGEGRIMITLIDQLEAHTGLACPGQAVFVGRGNHFQIWHPDAWAERQREANNRARAFWQSGGAAQ